MRLAATAALAALACSGPPLRPSEHEIAVHGSVRYEARHETPTGASQAIDERPARFVDLALLDAEGEVLAEGRTDAQGQFELRAPSGATQLRVYARAHEGSHDVAVASDPIGRHTHSFDAPISTEAPIAVVAREDERSGDAGAMHIADVLLRGVQAVRAWTGRELPPVFAYWARGGTRDWSFYRGERPPGSGRYGIELLGGDPGQQSISDTDEHDEAIVLHELGHFVMDRLTTDSSAGGDHPRGTLVDPGLAWEEGRATWLALAVQRDPLYRDTIGLEPWGRLRVDEDMEASGWGLAGLGSEVSVCRVLWDLGDGAGEIADRDSDEIAIGPSAILESMIALSAEDGAYPALPSFLAYLVQCGRLSEPELRSMLQRTGEPDILLPRAGDEETWPRALELGRPRTGKIDGFTQPAPSGGPNLPRTGFDAVHTYRVRVERAGLLSLRLAIVGSGRAVDHEDLDVELRDLRADAIAASSGEVPVEILTHLVQPGWYIVRVVDGGEGNRADYAIEARLESL